MAQFAGNHGLGFAHVVDGAFHGDDALEIEVVDVVDTAHGDLRVSVLHNFLDGGATLPDDTSNQIVVREDSQRDLAVGETKHDPSETNGRFFSSRTKGRSFSLSLSLTLCLNHKTPVA